jgi:hypothetical protein
MVYFFADCRHDSRALIGQSVVYIEMEWSDDKIFDLIKQYESYPCLTLPGATASNNLKQYVAPEGLEIVQMKCVIVEIVIRKLCEFCLIVLVGVW